MSAGQHRGVAVQLGGPRVGGLAHVASFAAGYETVVMQRKNSKLQQHWAMYTLQQFFGF